MTNVNLDHQPISILVRDVNGNRREYDMGYRDECYNVLINEDEPTMMDTDEILAVSIGEKILYSALGSKHITIEDLIGFFM